MFIAVRPLYNGCLMWKFGTSFLSFIITLGIAQATFAREACFDIFLLQTTPQTQLVSTELTDIPMVERYAYELRGEGNVHYLRSAIARAKYEWTLRDGLLFQLQNGKPVLLNTAVTKKDRNFDESLDTPLVEFVLSSGQQLFGMTRDQHARVFEDSGRIIHHSTFMGGAPVKFAGTIVVENGRITLLDNRSGHYRPGMEQFANFLNWLVGQGVDLSRTEMRIDNFHKFLDAGVSLRVLESHIPEFVFLARMENGTLETLRARIEQEFRDTGDSVLLYRTNFIWGELGRNAREMLVKVGERHGRTMPDLAVGAPPL